MIEHSIEVVVDECLNKQGKSFLRAYVYEDGNRIGVIPFKRNASPQEIAGDMFDIGRVYKKNTLYPPSGDIYIAASKKVPGL